MRRLITILLGAAALLRAADRPDAILLVTGDMHSAYDQMAQFAARVAAIRRDNAGVPNAVLIDGDTFELGNAVARRSEGAVEFALLASLARGGPTVLNLGNHEPEFFGLAETIARVRAAGVVVVGGNVRDPATGQPYAPASVPLPLGDATATIVGVTTDRLATFRVAVRPTLDLTDPVAWARASFPAELHDAKIPIVLSHAGLRADREMLALVPDGTLFAGAHDHLRLVHRAGRTVYFHSGSWTEYLTVARLRHDRDGRRWEVEQVRIDPADPADPALAALIRATLAKYLTAEETAVVGHLDHALDPAAAAEFAVAAARRAAGADVAVIGGTTFGGGLPAGEVTRYALDACVRFDGTLFVGEIDGARLQRLLARANQGVDTPFADRAGENLVAVAPPAIDPQRRYRIVTTDWIARNARSYLGDNPPVLQERSDLRLKDAVLKAFAMARVVPGAPPAAVPSTQGR